MKVESHRAIRIRGDQRTVARRVLVQLIGDIAIRILGAERLGTCVEPIDLLLEVIRGFPE